MAGDFSPAAQFMRRSPILLAAACCGILLSCAPAFAEDSINGTQTGGTTSTTTATSTGWVYDGTNIYFVSTPTTYTPPPGTAPVPYVAYSYMPACAGNTAAGSAVNCVAAQCPGGTKMWIFGLPPGANVGWQLLDTQCVPATKSFPVADLQAQLAAELKQLSLPAPVLDLDPDPATGAVALVNAPVRASSPAPAPGAGTLHVTVPLPATLQATPTETIEWGDGSAAERLAGTATHTYTVPGAKVITVTAAWNGSFTVDGTTITIPLPPVTLSTSRTLQVDQAQPVLIGNS